jgi:hypothetical protein
MSASGFHKTVGKIRSFDEANRLLVHAATHVKHDRAAVAVIVEAMLRLPLWRTEEQFAALERIAGRARRSA